MTVSAPEVKIDRLGAQGDGIVDAPSGPRYVPFALPGERVRAGASGAPELLSGPSPDRGVPICRHFGVCGGCVAQHMSDRLYAEWKRATVVEAFRHRGFETEIAPLVPIPPGSRRRAILRARRDRDGVMLGYHRRRSHELFTVEECPVLVPAIVAQLPALRAIAAAVAGRELRMTVLTTLAGLDVAVEGAPSRSDAKGTVEIARIAQQNALARVTIDGETIVERSVPCLTFGGAAVVPPPGAFVQAVAKAEAAMTGYVLAAVGKAKRVADLFCGLGTFTLPLARSARVLAVDGDAAALAALRAGASRTQGLKPIEANRRDLFREPLSPKELQGLDAVVLDPPRTGAQAQAQELARSCVPTIVAVSCNPATLARDARILVDGGYAIKRVMPIDQFLFSAEVEVVAVLRRSR